MMVGMESAYIIKEWELPEGLYTAEYTVDEETQRLIPILQFE